MCRELYFRHLDTDTLSEQLSKLTRARSATMRRPLVWLAAAGFAVASVAGLTRVVHQGRAIDNDDDAWAHVRQHEERFIMALRQGSAAEGDDASC